MKLSPKLMHALSDYWNRKFNAYPGERVDAELLLAVPAEAVLRDKENTFTVIHDVRGELTRIGTSEKCLKLYSYYGFAPIAYYFSMFPANRFSSAELDELVGEVRLCYERGRISRQPYQIIRKAAMLIRSYLAKGSLDEKDATTRRGSKFILSNEFEVLIKFYAEKIGEYRCVSPSTLPTRLGAIRGFLAQLERQGVKTVAGITYAEVNACITQNARKYSLGSKN